MYRRFHQFLVDLVHLTDDYPTEVVLGGQREPCNNIPNLSSCIQELDQVRYGPSSYSY